MDKIVKDKSQLGCVRWLALPMLFFALLQLSAAWNLWQTPSDITIRLAIPLTGLSLVTLGWGVGASVITMLLWWRGSRVLVWAVVFILAYLGMDIVRQVIWITADYERGRHPFVFTLIAFYAVIALIFLLRHSRHGNQNGDKS